MKKNDSRHSLWFKPSQVNYHHICHEKGHISSSCPNGNIPKPPLVNDHYLLRKDVVGNLFAKFVGAQSGLEMEKAIWVAKPIVSNFLGPNLVGDHQAQP